MNVLLISTYELGRQPFGLASPAAWLRREGITVRCLDLSVEHLSADVVASADLIAIYLPMHTATRLAAAMMPRIRAMNPSAHVCFYGLYAPANEQFLRELGGQTILGGEFEEGLVDLARRLAERPTENGRVPSRSPVSLARQRFLQPDRSGLPPLVEYARLNVAPGDQRIVGYTEATRGCKHRCRHCPIVPVYDGRFRVVQADVVLQDIEQQVESGAQHITFGDPDFFNGPRHASSIVQELHRRFPRLTYDVTIKIEHLLKHDNLLPLLRDTGCVLVTSAVESIDDRVLEILEKHHTREDVIRAVSLLRNVGLALNPTFVSFTPWTTLRGYRELLSTILALDLVENVSPIQYAIRLLIPAGSRLLELHEIRELVGDFDRALLCYSWSHPDPSVDDLHRDVLRRVQVGSGPGCSRESLLEEIWEAVDGRLEEASMGRPKVGVAGEGFRRPPIPYLTEPWYC